MIGTPFAGAFFYPLIEASGSGGDGNVALLTNIVLGTIGGAIASPIAGGAGFFFGYRLGNRTPSLRVSVLLVAFGAALASIPWLLLGGYEDPSTVWLMPLLGIIATTVALALFQYATPALDGGSTREAKTPLRTK